MIKLAVFLFGLFCISFAVSGGGNGQSTIRRFLVGEDDDSSQEEEIDELAGGTWDDTQPLKLCGVGSTCDSDGDCRKFDEQCTCGFHYPSRQFRCFYPSPIADVLQGDGDDDESKFCKTGTCKGDKDCPGVCTCGFSLDIKKFKCYYPSPIADDVLQDDDPS